jgi:hypothetical protein
VRRAWLLIAPAVLLLASCGDTLSLDPVAKAATASSKQTSEHMELTAKVTTGGQTVSMTGEGDFRNDPNLGRMTMSVQSAGKTFTMREVLSGLTVYIASDLFKGQLPSGKSWMAIDLTKTGKALGLDVGGISSQSPVSTLDQLKANGDVTKVGTETIDGVETTHYTATIDPAKTAKLAKALHITVSYKPADVWIDANGLVRRMHLAYSQTAGTSTPASTNDTTISFSNYGTEVQVDLPSPADTFDATSVANSSLKNGGKS